MKDSSVSKITITKTGHQSTQYKKIVDTLPVLYVDKNYQGIDDIIWTGNNLVDADFMWTYQNANNRSNTHHVQISTVNLVDPEAADDLRPPPLKPWSNHTSLTQISRRNYYWYTRRISRTSLKSTPSSLPTRRL